MIEIWVLLLSSSLLWKDLAWGLSTSSMRFHLSSSFFPLLLPAPHSPLSRIIYCKWNLLDSLWIVIISPCATVFHDNNNSYLVHNISTFMSVEKSWPTNVDSPQNLYHIVKHNVVWLIYKSKTWSFMYGYCDSHLLF